MKTVKTKLKITNKSNENHSELR